MSEGIDADIRVEMPTDRTPVTAWIAPGINVWFIMPRDPGLDPLDEVCRAIQRDSCDAVRSTFEREDGIGRFTVVTNLVLGGVCLRRTTLALLAAVRDRARAVVLDAWAIALALPGLRRRLGPIQPAPPPPLDVVARAIAWDRPLSGEELGALLDGPDCLERMWAVVRIMERLPADEALMLLSESDLVAAVESGRLRRTIRHVWQDYLERTNAHHG